MSKSTLRQGIHFSACSFSWTWFLIFSLDLSVSTSPSSNFKPTDNSFVLPSSGQLANNRSPSMWTQILQLTALVESRLVVYSPQPQQGGGLQASQPLHVQEGFRPLQHSFHLQSNSSPSGLSSTEPTHVRPSKNQPSKGLPLELHPLNQTTSTL